MWFIVVPGLLLTCCCVHCGHPWSKWQINKNKLKYFWQTLGGREHRNQNWKTSIRNRPEVSGYHRTSNLWKLCCFPELHLRVLRTFIPQRRQASSSHACAPEATVRLRRLPRDFRHLVGEEDPSERTHGCRTGKWQIQLLAGWSISRLVLGMGHIPKQPK